MSTLFINENDDDDDADDLKYLFYYNWSAVNHTQRQIEQRTRENTENTCAHN